MQNCSPLTEVKSICTIRKMFDFVKIHYNEGECISIWKIGIKNPYYMALLQKKDGLTYGVKIPHCNLM